MRSSNRYTSRNLEIVDTFMWNYQQDKLCRKIKLFNDIYHHDFRTFHYRHKHIFRFFMNSQLETVFHQCVLIRGYSDAGSYSSFLDQNILRWKILKTIFSLFRHEQTNKSSSNILRKCINKTIKRIFLALLPKRKRKEETTAAGWAEWQEQEAGDAPWPERCTGDIPFLWPKLGRWVNANREAWTKSGCASISRGGAGQRSVCRNVCWRSRSGVNWLEAPLQTMSG